MECGSSSPVGVECGSSSRWCEGVWSVDPVVLWVWSVDPVVDGVRVCVECGSSSRWCGSSPVVECGVCIQQSCGGVVVCVPGGFSVVCVTSCLSNDE